ncbi:MAG: histidine kinase [Saprospiraceae bacterium]|nr:histidine kinase [Saprospiraceae bacterium]
MSGISSFCNGQQYPWINFTTEDGLPTNYVYGAMQIGDYIWVYTEDGLCRYDGLEFVNYTTKDGLPDNDIFMLEKGMDEKGTISTFNPTFTRIENDSLSEKPTHLDFISGHQLVNGGIPTIFFRDTFFTHEQFAEHIRNPYKRFYPKPSTFFPGGEIFEIDFPSKIITVRVDDEVNKYYSERLATVEISFDKKSKIRQGISNHQFILLHSDGAILIRNDRKEKKEVNWEDYNLTTDNSFQCQVSWPFVYLQTNTGFIKIDSNNVVVDHFLIGDLSSKADIRRIIDDVQGNIWVGSRDAGLFLLPNHCRNSAKVSLKSNDARFFRGLISLGQDSLICFSEAGIPFLVSMGKNSGPLVNKNLGSFYAATTDRNSNVYWSSFPSIHMWNKKTGVQNFLESFNAITNKSTLSYRGVENPIDIRSIKQLIWDESSKALLATHYDELVRLIPQGKDLIIEDQRLKIFDFSARAEGGVWIAGGEGIYKHYSNSLDSIFWNPQLEFVSKIFENDEKLWIGTEDKGLFFFDPDNEMLQGPLPILTINNFARGLNGNILVSTNNGLLRLDKSDGTLLHHYRESSGLSSNQVLDALETEKGLFVAGNRGLDFIGNVEPSLSQDQLAIDLIEVLVNGNRIQGLKSKHSFSSRQDNFEFLFSLKDFQSAGDISFHYKLSPVNDDWAEAQSNRLSFLGLPPGSYSLEVKAERYNGKEIFYPENIDFKIRRPFWNSWTYGAIGFLVAGLFFLWYRNRHLERLEKVELEKNLNLRISEMRLTALRAQMNPHFMFNALGAIQYFVSNNDIDQADFYLTKFSRLLRKYLEASRNPSVSLYEEIEILKLYTELEEMRFEGKFKTQIHVDPGIDLMDVHIPSVLVQPFAENSILHGLQKRKDGKGLLKIDFRKNQDDLVVEVFDNGIGFKNSKNHQKSAHKSRGISDVVDRIETLSSSGRVEVQMERRIPYPGNPNFPGHKVILTFNNIVA